MRYLLAMFVALGAFGVPAVSYYFPAQTNAVLTVFDHADTQTAAAIQSQPSHFQPVVAPAQMQGVDYSIYPPRPI